MRPLIRPADRIETKPETKTANTAGGFRSFAPVRIVLPVALTIALFVATLFGLILPQFKTYLVHDRRDMIRELTRSAWSTLDSYYQQERAGRLTREDAQLKAVEHLRQVRYGADGKDYFWINDMSPRLIMHPYRQDLEGQAVADYTDPNGKRLFVEMVRTVRQHGEGFVDYQWQWKDDPSHIVPKISFVQGFRPWEWVVGTGIYMEDVRQQIGAMTRRLTVASILILLAIGVLSGVVVWQGAKAETARRRAESESRLQREQLFQADKMATLGTLVSGVGHEVNNPATFIMLNAPIIDKAWHHIVPILDDHMSSQGDFKVGGMAYSKLRERMPALVRNIGEGAQRIKAIVNDLKDYARPDPSSLSGDVDINLITQKAVGLVKNLIHKSTRQFHVELTRDAPLVKGNAQRIEQVVINLLVNACHALENHGQPIEISTALDAENKTVVLTVCDHGRGISPEILDRIRDPFFTTKRRSGGTGLGLAIADRIVIEHGGRMYFDSAPGRGTTVEVVFPLSGGKRVREA